MNTILKTHQLSKSFKEFKAVDNLSFEVNQGDIFGFLGQNGAGKSTTIRMLLSLIQPEAG
ncbi:MAG: ATP-binding cassette domain-containing protein, partial [Bacteroidota bacterium]